MLGRIITYTEQGFSHEPDPGHMEKVVHELKLSDCKGVATPGVKDDTTVTAAELLERRKCYPPSDAQNLRRKEVGHYSQAQNAFSISR